MGKLISKGKHSVKVGNHPHKNRISNPAFVRRGEYTCRISEMHQKLRDQQHNLVYIQTAISKPHGNCKAKIYNRYTQQKKKESKHNTKDSHQITGEQKRNGRKKTYKNKYKTINKMEIRTDISVITLNVNGLNVPTKRHRQVEWIQKQDLYT